MLKNRFGKVLCGLTIVLLAAVLLTRLILISKAEPGVEFVALNAVENSGDRHDAGTVTENKAAETIQASQEQLAQVQVDLTSETFSDRYNRSARLLEGINLGRMTGLSSDLKLFDVTTATKVVEEEIPYPVEQQQNPALAAGVTEVVREGAAGLARVTYLETFHDGKSVRTEEIKRETVREPVTQVIQVGTYSEPEQPVADRAVEPEVNAASEAVQPTEPVVQPEPEGPVETPAPPTDVEQSVVEQPVTEQPVVEEPVVEESTAPAVSPVQFVSPGSDSAASANLSAISGLIQRNGSRCYGSYSDNGNGTLTVDGYTFAYTSVGTHAVTGYDGLEVCVNAGCHHPAVAHNTSSGLKTQRGIVATVFPQYGGFPPGTVLFIDNYGLAVVGDLNGCGALDSSWLDVCYDDGELLQGSINPGKSYRTVYVISTP